jgi:hypothetical protein
MILDLAVGGGWPGNPDYSTSFPQTMTVDSVRASAWDSGTSQTGAIKGIGGMCADVAGASDTAPTGIRLMLTPFS